MREGPPQSATARQGHVPRATAAAAGAAAGDGETASADGLVLQCLVLLREQLEALAEKMEHNQRSLLEAVGALGQASQQIEKECGAVAEEFRAGPAGGRGGARGGALGASSAPAGASPANGHEPAIKMPAGAPAVIDNDGDSYGLSLTPVSLGPPEPFGADGPGVAPASAGEDSDGDEELERSVKVKRLQHSVTQVSEGLGEASVGLDMVQHASSLSQVEIHQLSTISRHLTANKVEIKRNRVHLNYGPGKHRKDIKAWAVRLCSTSHFETTVAVSILSNAILIGWNSHWAMRNIGSDRPVSFIVLDWIFLAIFMLELMIRMAAEGYQFLQFGNKMFGWNVFDGVIIGLTLLNNVEVLGVRLSVVRVFRVLRLVHVIRMIRLKNGFRELRMMVDGIMNCGKTLLWSFLLLIVITFIYAVVCLEFIAEWLAQAEQEPMASTAGLGQADQETKMSTIKFVKDNYSSLHYSVYTLFKAVSGGVNWGELSDPMEHVNIVLVLTFPLFIGVTVFCVLNIITAAFVDAAARKSKEEEANALEYISERKKWIKTVNDIFARHDSDSRGTLDIDEFSSIMTDWRTQTALTDMGIDLSFQKAQQLFRLFDFDGDGQIDINEFAQGIHHLKGPARSLDVLRHFMKLTKQIDKLDRHFVKLLQHDRSSRSVRSRGFSDASSRSSLIHFQGAALEV